VVKTSISLPDELVAEARALDINISALARDALDARVKQLQAAQAEGMQLIKTAKDGVPVAFWGRNLAQHADTETMAFVTEKGSLVLLDFGDQQETAGVGDCITRVYESPDDFFTEAQEGLRAAMRSGDAADRQMAISTNDFLSAIAEGLGVTHHRVLDL